MEKTTEKYTKYERARMIGSRALQISMGAPPMMTLDKKALEALRYNPLEIAKQEFELGIIPLKIKRPLPGDKKRKVKDKKE
ncbi:MAG: DNA-directed RNA polymerase subunit K [Candidatus Woesearchaeota archaeon]|nr:DNA-directed RNA polymerase subunit K [Candidatus Woesearchaeota archaeon]